MLAYLDYNASAPLNPKVLEAMLTIYQTAYGNSESLHPQGFAAAKIIENARACIAILLETSPFDVIFTSGATESNNLALWGLAEYGIRSGRQHILASAVEHKSVLNPLKGLQRQGFEVELVQPEANGRVNAQDFLARVRPDTLLASLMHVNNETGVIQPIREVGTALREQSVFFHVDAAQSAGKLINELKAAPWDMVSLTAHKMGGPQGIGALALRYNKTLPLIPRALGGDQEWGLRAGTVPTALAAGFGKACELAINDHAVNRQSWQSNRTAVLECLQTSGVDFSHNADPTMCLPTTLNVSFANVNSIELLERGGQYCCVSPGSACNCKSGELSHVLLSMGLSEDCVRSSVRFSWGNQQVNKDQMMQFFKIIKELQSKA